MDPIRPSDEDLAALVGAAHNIGQLISCYRQADSAWLEWAELAKKRKREIDRLRAALQRIADDPEETCWSEYVKDVLAS